MNRIIASIQRVLPRSKINIFGKDSLIHTSAPYYMLSLITLSGLMLKNPNPFPFIAIVYAAIPILDEVFSLDQRNPTTEERKKLENQDFYFRLTLYSSMILDWAAFLKTCITMQTFELTWGTLLHLIGIIFITSNLAASQFAVAHEVMHKPGRFYRVLATLHMSKLYYTHFTFHHLYKHHRDVATPKDPSTSLKGETLYQYLVRTVRDSWVCVYQEEKANGKKLWNNYAILSIVSTVVFSLLVYLIFGLQTFIVTSIVSLGAIIYLQTINYLEHYGLQRKLLQNGEYEKTTILHSWNAPHRFSNYLLFKLQRHSDHHENGSKPFQTLTTCEQSPFLPHGYTLMVLMAFFPSVWFKVMDPLVDECRKLTLNGSYKMNLQVKQKAVTETRRFLVEVALSSLGLLLISIQFG